MIRYLHNTTDKDVRFAYAYEYPRQEHVVGAGQTVAFPDAVVAHYLAHVHIDGSPLEEVNGVVTEPKVKERRTPIDDAKKVVDVVDTEDISALRWSELQKLARTKGVYKIGMKRIDVEAALLGLDDH